MYASARAFVCVCVEALFVCEKLALLLTAHGARLLRLLLLLVLLLLLLLLLALLPNLKVEVSCMQMGSTVLPNIMRFFRLLR